MNVTDRRARLRICGLMVLSALESISGQWWPFVHQNAWRSRSGAKFTTRDARCRVWGSALVLVGQLTDAHVRWPNKRRGEAVTLSPSYLFLQTWYHTCSFPVMSTSVSILSNMCCSLYPQSENDGCVGGAERNTG
jgi:hypothetical protein